MQVFIHIRLAAARYFEKCTSKAQAHPKHNLTDNLYELETGQEIMQ